MNPRFKTCWLGLTLIAATAADAEGLGRLFFTPEQRMQLEQGEKQNPAAAEPARLLTINGFVQKHGGGGRTVWINGVPQFSGKGDARAAASLPVSAQDQDQWAPGSIKAGQKALVHPPVHRE